MKAPLPATEPQRLEALTSCDILDTPREPAFDDLTRIASTICGTPIASLVEQTRRLEDSLSAFAGKQE